MKFNLTQLEDLFYNINEIINYIENSKLKNRRYILRLSNGDHLNYSVPNESIPHLLGINIPYLDSLNIFKEHNSFELLKHLTENAYKIYELESKGIIDLNNLFSPFILEKVNNFRENTTIRVEDVEFVCKYNSERSYIHNDNFEKYDYLILKKLSNDKFGILTLVRNTGYFTPMSNQIFDDYESVKEKLQSQIKHQEITLLESIEIYYNNNDNIYDDNYKKIYLNLSKKREKLESLREYKGDFDVSIDVANDFLYSIKKLTQNKYTNTKNNLLIDKIIACIEEGKLIEIDYYEDSYLMPIINAYNDSICSINGNNDRNIQTYTQLKNTLEELKGQLRKLEIQNVELENENNNLNEENSNLKEENKNLNDTHNKVLELLKPRN